ncbi:TM1266 family iron-only hydrogenase system putative regulator [Megasphaera vaginalis (ex Bordigoni et al. 2020)]|uniref:TM1266 family iron-only hydrogenase system putative regulator n=1 Tax=Megasphaera vaginalis (ex Bordigoni et al. 2020) TaxID=2045301 RepID=UPI000C7C5681|nr:TM1266 family iron-only hydrogenase system putative regulator [Megasphaera vaginalis (ex Bordigoni et al. 2020)]
MEETRVALIGIIVSDPAAAEALNEILHTYNSYIIGRMGLPYQQRNISVISIVLDAPQPVISAVAGKLGMVPHVTAKTIYANLPD